MVCEFINGKIYLLTDLTIYKLFVRPHLDYGNFLYHQPYNESINSKLESI